MLVPIVNYASGQTDSEQFRIEHAKTIEVSYSSNYYSYNFAAYPVQNTIDQIKIKIISYMENNIIEIQKDISPPRWNSFGTMIHASDPENGSVDVIRNLFPIL